jgi:hypothetical protein
VAVGAGRGVGVGSAAAGGVAAAGAFDTAGDWVLPGALTPLAPESGEAAVGLVLDPGGAADPTSVALAGEVLADGLPASPPTSSVTPTAVALGVVDGRNTAPMTIAPISDGSSARETTVTDRMGTIGVAVSFSRSIDWVQALWGPRPRDEALHIAPKGRASCESR